MLRQKSDGRIEPGVEQSLDVRGGTAQAQLFAKTPIGQHLRCLGQDSEMFFGRLLWDQQDQHVGHGLAVGGIERDRRFWADVRDEYLAEILDARVGDGGALTQSGRSDLFPMLQAGRHGLMRHRMRPLHMPADFIDELAFV